MAIAACVVIVYTVLGGLLADVITDLVQGVTLILGLGIISFLVLADVGGVAALLEKVPAARWSLVGEEGSFWISADIWAVPVFGSLISQELITRVNAAKSADVAYRSCLFAAGIYLFIGSVPVVLGLVGPEIISGLDHPEQLLPTLAEQHLPWFLYVMFSGALVSAILSTVDSSLLSVSALASKNVFQSYQPALSEKQKLLSARLGLVGFGLLAYAIAKSSDSIHDLVVEASAVGGGGFLVVVLFGLFSRIGQSPSAVAALVTGAAIWGVGTFVIELQSCFLAAVAGSTVSYLAFAPLGSRTALEFDEDSADAMLGNQAAIDT
jgi:Na+/proline symporter